MPEPDSLNIKYPLRYTQVRVVFAVVEKIKFPAFAGSAIRGSFGWAFKKTTCVTNLPDCTKCPLYENCVYAYVFDTPTKNKNGILQKTPFAPHPFVITPEINKRTFDAGEKLSFILTLFGRALDFLPFFLNSFETFNEIKLSGGKVHFLHASQGNRVLYTGKKIISAPKIDEINPDKFTKNFSLNKVRVHFQTPTKIINRGKLTMSPDFETLIRAIARRLNWLTTYHEKVNGNTLSFPLSDAREIEKDDVKVTSIFVKRYSNRKKQKMQFKSFQGFITYKGENLERFYPLLKIGEIIHVGKATSFGFGKIKLKEDI